MENSEFELEKEKLKEVVEKFKETIKYYELRAQAVPKLYKDNELMIENFINMYDEKMQKMFKTINSPYFARMDFKRENENTVQSRFKRQSSGCDGRSRSDDERLLPRAC